MYQHQHTPLPIDLLETVPQPVVVLLNVLLEKDPARRFQNPTELLKAIPTITGAIDARRIITRQKLQKIAPPTSRVGTRKPPARLGPKKISLARLPVTGSDIFGREEDIAFLDVMGKPADKCRYHRCLGWCWEVHASQPLAPRMAAEHYRSASSFLAGHSTDRAPAETLRPQTNSLTLPSLGLEIPIHTSERRGKRAKDWRTRDTSSKLIDTGWFGALQNPPGPKRDGYVSLLFRRCCANWLLSIRAFA